MKLTQMKLTQMKMKPYLIGLGWLLPAVIIIGLGFKLSNDAIAVIVGMVLGVLATLPLNLMLVFALKQQEKAAQRPMQNLQTPNQPPVVVVSGGQVQPTLAPPSTPRFDEAFPLNPERTFTIVGEEVLD